MAFNKAKILAAAQKALDQGKIPQAIAEYQQILRHEPDDQVTLMTIGDLFVRGGDTSQALPYFEKLAQLFVNDGFISKSIAIYKKIAKLAPEEINPLERLAELYVQQGVMSEARPIYLQLAEAHLKANRTPQGIEVLRKLLDLAPDNLRVQMRLAELYQAIGQGKEAAHAFLNSAHRMFERGELAEAQKMAERAISADPAHTGAVTMKARIIAAMGHPKEAIALLEAMPGAAASDDANALLTDLYLQAAQPERAVELARKAIKRGPEHFGVAYNAATALLEGGAPDLAVKLLGELRTQALEAGDSERLVQALAAAIERMAGKLEPMDMLADVYRHIGDTFRLPDILNQLAETAIASGNLERAKIAFEEMAGNDPENETIRRRLEQVCGQLGVEPTLRVAPRPEQTVQVMAVPIEEVVAEAVPAVEAVPAAEAPLDEDTERFINQSLTDVDLFSSYGLTQKGIDLLETVLQRVPKHTGALEKLLDLCLGAGNDRRTSDLAAQLEQIYSERGDMANADKFSELRRRFQRAAGRAEEAAPLPAEFAIPTEAAAAAEVEAVPAAPAEEEVQVEVVGAEEEAAVHEVDLSEEWAMMTGQAAPAEAAPPAAPPPPPPAEAAPPAPSVVEEGIPLELPVEAPAAEAPAPEAPAPLTAEEIVLEAEIVHPEPPPPPPPPVEAPPGVSAAAPPEPVPAVEEAVSYDLAVESVTEEVPEAPAPPPPPPAEVPVAEGMKEIAAEVAPPAPEIAPEPEPVPVAAAEPEAAPVPVEAPGETVEYEFETTSAEAPAEQPAEAVAEVAAAPGLTSDQFLAELSDELGDILPAAAASVAAPPGKAPAKGKGPAKAGVPPKVAAAAPAEGKGETVEQLREVFEEFRAEMGEMGEEAEDLETHYNLGIAYREMGLLEEAIGEFQKVAKAMQAGRQFRYAMQCYTLLGLAFMDKGQPKIASIWYEKALRTPELDPETILAVRYDLGVAQALAGDTKAALDSFSQVYAMNIDYRDVAERIASLSKP